MAQLAATASSRCISKFDFDMPPWEDSNFDAMETCVKQASSPQRKLFSWKAATVCTTPCKSVFRRKLKEMNFHFSVRPDGACHQWRRVPPRELSIALVADERFGWVTGWIEAS
jgi:hypothetical protein